MSRSWFVHPVAVLAALSASPLAAQQHCRAICALPTCVFRQFPDGGFGNSRTGISVIPGQGFR